MFSFGENWASFSQGLSEERIQQAIQSLVILFGESTLKGTSFLDIGCGSGLFSIAAARLGARKILGVDVDPLSVETSRRNAARWLKANDIEISFCQGSVLDENDVTAWGTFDVVYSWGVLHHTGNMWKALENASRTVKPNGWFVVALYNRHWSSPIWKWIKRLYNRLGKFGKRLMIGSFFPLIVVAKWLVTLRNPFKMRRGMDFLHNVIDWLGGYPYEYASIEEVRNRLSQLGFDVLAVYPARVPTGCNEYVCRRRTET
jgi:SAM-dependent methyltransferase